VASKKSISPTWREHLARAGSYRAAFSFDPERIKHPSAGWVAMFQDEFGMADADFQRPRSQGDAPVSLGDRPGMDPQHRTAIAHIVGEDNVEDDDFSRVRYGHGKSLDENLALRAGRVEAVPDLVVHPRDKADVAAIVAYCAEHAIPVIPYGAGSGVVIGSRADRGGVVLVMRTHMNQILAINERNMTAVVQPGLIGSDFEAELNDAPRLRGTAHAYTCGHFPQSFEMASVGGWITALGSGQASTYYGDAYDLIISQEYVTPVGTIRTRDVPAFAAGPKVNDILKGSEGTFGVLVEATVKIFRHRPENTQRFAFMFPNWQAAVEFSREVVQGEFGMPAILRISDPEETERGLALKGFDAGMANAFLAKRGFKPWQRCLCVGTAEGEKGFAKNVAAQTKRIARAHGGMSLTSFAEKQWEHGRYADAYIREDILDFGMVIDTLETAVTWDTIYDVHTGVREFVKSRPGTVCMTHASHFYPQGTNLYFILILRPEDEQEYFRFRASVIDKILEFGGSTSHHHGAGNLFGPWIEGYLGTAEMDVLRALKRHFDPDGIMNPGNTLGLGGSAS
jgi:alkyldihydroxyacetonephosphate synthase